MYVSLVSFLPSLYMKCHRAYLITLTYVKAILRPYPKGIVHHPPIRSLITVLISNYVTTYAIEYLSWMSRSISWRHFFRICTSAERASLVCFSRACRLVSWISTTTLVTSLATEEIASLRSSVLLSNLRKKAFLLKIQIFKSQFGHLVFVPALANGYTFSRPCH